MGRGHVLKKQKILKNTHPMALSHHAYHANRKCSKAPYGGQTKATFSDGVIFILNFST